MSLRTKLIAAIVGLPGAILLLAIVLFSRETRATPPEAIGAVLDLVSSDNRPAIGPGILEQLRVGNFAAAHVVREPPQNKPGGETTVWTAKAFFAIDGRSSEPDVTDPDEIARVLERRRVARGSSPPRAVRREYLAISARHPDTTDHPYVVVMEMNEPQHVARTVYWVMVAGIALLIVVFTILISMWVIRPLEKLSAAADRIADGDFGATMEPHDAGDEFGRTISALNRMASEIGEYQGQLEEKVLDALGRIKKTEQHLIIAQRLAATGKLAAGLAHEINNPLGGIKNAINSLKRGDLSVEKTGLYFDLVSDGLTRVEQTVKKFLTYTPRRIEPRPTDLADIASKSVGLAMHRIRKRGIEVESSFPEDGDAIVFGDPHELQQVALNLVLNAADAIEAGRSDGLISVRVERRDEDVVLIVADNGTGMSAEDQDRCFDMFFTTKQVGEGSGMGLSVVHNVVSNHGGRLELTSALGEGTTFEVILPRDARPDEEAGPGAGEAAPAPAARES